LSRHEKAELCLPRSEPLERVAVQTTPPARREIAFINVAKFLEIVMRSQHRVGINNHEQPVIWVLRRLVDYCCYFKSFATP
jgi:hypothetical protein